MEELPKSYFITYFLMEGSENLYSNYAPNNAGRLLHTCQATRIDDGDVTVAIY